MARVVAVAVLAVVLDVVGAEIVIPVNVVGVVVVESVLDVTDGF